MPAGLPVFPSGDLIGHLVEEGSGGWAFVYDPEFLRSQPNRKVLSLNCPPRETAYRGADLAALCRNLLPDGDIRRQLARKRPRMGRSHWQRSRSDAIRLDRCHAASAPSCL